MHKAIVFTGIILFLATSLSLAEELTITTYYPSPFGVYNQLNTNTLGVGDNDGSGSIGSGDAPDPNDPDQVGDVWIAGDVGIGIGDTPPTEKLDVNGKIIMRDVTEAGDSDETVLTKGYMDIGSSLYECPSYKEGVCQTSCLGQITVDATCQYVKKISDLMCSGTGTKSCTYLGKLLQ